jgi:hypothetical protein
MNNLDTVIETLGPFDPWLRGLNPVGDETSPDGPPPHPFSVKTIDLPSLGFSMIPYVLTLFFFQMGLGLDLN